MAIRRLTKELQSIDKSDGVFLQVTTDDGDVFDWHVVLTGPKGTPYSGGKFHFKVDCPGDYPFKPPKIRLVTPILHPVVDYTQVRFTKVGGIGNSCACNACMKEHWSPALTCERILRLVHIQLGATFAQVWEDYHSYVNFEVPSYMMAKGSPSQDMFDILTNAAQFYTWQVADGPRPELFEFLTDADYFESVCGLNSDLMLIVAQLLGFVELTGYPLEHKAPVEK